MWTPRRVTLLLLGIAGFVAAYALYARFLGRIDGLPELPPDLATPSGDSPDFPQPGVSQTVRRLAGLFGDESPEVTDPAYTLKVDMPDKGLVIASGQPRFAAEPSRFVTVSPFSVGFFARPKGQLPPGEVEEASTFHADRAVLEFDQEVRNAQDVSGKAKLVGMELVSVPDLLSRDDRKGRVWMTNNQRSKDPGQFLVFRTTGPLYYRSPDRAAPPAPDAPQIWTAAEVEVVDKRNLPRPLRSSSTNTAVARGDDLRNRGAVEAILLGTTLPPPTVTAVGMKVYLQPSDPKNPAKKNTTGFAGVRRIELSEKVRFCQWSDGGGGVFVGNGGQPAKPAVAPPADPPAAAGGVLGGFADGAAVARRMESKTLLVVETLGSFRHDFQTDVARFEAAPVNDSPVPNHVAVAQVSATGKQDSLFCRLMVVEFAGGAEPPAAKPPAAKPAEPAAAAKPPEGKRIKALTATGDYVYVAFESDQLEAQGNELRYTTDPANRRTLTVLRGFPVNAVREKNTLQGGTQKALGEIVIATTDPPPNQKDGRKQTAITVLGPGKIDVFDQVANARTLHATWGKSLTHEKVKVGNVEQDLLKFDGGGAFIDNKADMRLSADLLKLWLAAKDETPGGKAKPAGSSNNALPQQLVAIGRVESTSPDLVIRETDQLTLWFRDVPPPEGPAPSPMPAATPRTVAGKTEPPAAGPKKPAEPEKPPAPPVHLSARVIESWVRRYPQKPDPARPGQPVVAADPAKPDAKSAEPTLKYELERALCEDRVVVHQDPTDPTKNPRGLDISGIKLNLEGSKAGSVMTVTGTEKNWAEVHFEGLSLYGPTVVIDQPQNAASVDGAGAAVLPGQSDPAAPGDRPTELKINWQRSMTFEGAKARAEFVGLVKALQQPAPATFRTRPEVAPVPRTQPIGLVQAPKTADGTVKPPTQPPADDGSFSRKWLLCHRLDVTFDRPVYFNNYRRAGDKPPPPKPGQPKKAESEPAKLETALCVRMPDDEAAKLPTPPLRNWVTFLDETFTKDGKLLKAQRVDAPEIYLRNSERGRVVDADGPGEVRLLQPGSKEAFEPPRQGPPAPPAAKQPPKKDEQEMKLTFVRYLTKMRAEEIGNSFQKVTFLNGARVWHVPSENLYLPIVEHALPPRTVFLSCTEQLVVTSDSAKGTAQPEQWMEATGDAEFQSEDYFGSGYKITYDGKAVTIEGRRGVSLARLRQTRRGVNQDPGWNAERIVYYKTGEVRTTGNATGTFIPGQ